ncbi:glycosyltransferase family 17 protein [Nitzschia inconspicua]|uniref:Glycosyltransferase family 17 protein n=2 Tax=Nitzschia inconspicua TaxID=303405 RepID=A0A9K3LZC1_9STRA|nr:glycosyltransferase family 17 protein [Nitzschia inconspicua]
MTMRTTTIQERQQKSWFRSMATLSLLLFLVLQIFLLSMYSSSVAFMMQLGDVTLRSFDAPYFGMTADYGIKKEPTVTSLTPTTLFREEYFSEEDGILKGILSTKPKSFFKRFQQDIDNFEMEERCHRYGFSMKAKDGQPERPNRRIYYGALIADEPWELLDIIATETHGIFEGMVFVESNRTQMLFERPIKRANKQKYIDQFKEMFGVEKLQIREYANEESTATGLVRENNQRAEILKGWKELGMTKDDVGYIADMDESFTRDFLRAVQQCPYVEYFDYEAHKCVNSLGKSRLVGATRVFESSPECVTKYRKWYHPDMIIGACVEEIGDDSVHPRAPRSDGLYRDEGWARSGSDVQNLPDNSSYPLHSAGDFRMLGGGSMVGSREPNSSGHSAFHLHNFFADFNTTRYKYLTYGHPDRQALKKPLEDLHVDIRLLVRCVYNETDGPINSDADYDERQDFQRVEGGLDTNHPVFPIYFHDEDYRRRKHDAISRLVKEDEYSRMKRLNLTTEELEMDVFTQRFREAKRFVWAHEARVQAFRQKVKEKAQAL